MDNEQKRMVQDGVARLEAELEMAEELFQLATAATKDDMSDAVTEMRAALVKLKAGMEMKIALGKMLLKIDSGEKELGQHPEDPPVPDAIKKRMGGLDLDNLGLG